MKIAICDDEFYQRNMLAQIIEKLAKGLGVRIQTKQYMSGEDLVKRLEDDMYCYDIILLDIQMKALSGIDVAKIVRQTNQSAIIIFITGVADYVFEGYNVKAFNYILKPIDEERVTSVISEAIKTLEVQERPYYTLTTKEGTFNIDLEEILYFKSDRRTIEAVTTKGNYVFYSKLDEIEEGLGEKQFLRVHQRYLLNLLHIDRISEGQAFLKNGEVITISRNRYKETMVAFARGILR